MENGQITVEIWIRDFVTPDGGYLITATAEPGNLSAEGTFDPASVPDDVVADALEAMDVGNLDAAATEEVGRTLFNALFTGEVATLYETAKDRGRLRLRLVVDVPAAQLIPWELMHDGARFLAIAGPFSRGFRSLVPADPPTATLPLRILIVDAFPAGVEKLDSQLEAAGIAAALQPLVEDGQADVTPMSGATLEGLLDELRGAAAGPVPRPFHVLHFIGHGKLDKKSGRSYLLFEKPKTKAPHLVNPDALIDIIGDYDLKLVFLNACESVGTTAQATAETFAPALLGNGTPAVIGMQTSVFDMVAITFADQFYRALADNTAVDEALMHARRIVKTSDRDAVSHIGVPVCYLRSETGRILDMQPPPQREGVRDDSGRRRPFTKLIDWVVAPIVGALVLGTLALIINWWQGPDRMNELSFNVAVAEFATADGARSATANDLSLRLSEQVGAALEELDFTDVWGPEQAGRVGGDTPGRRAEEAEKLADRINADVVVYGVLQGEGSAGEFIPEFYVNDRQLSGASELTGSYGLGDGEPFDSTIDAVDELKDRLVGRASGLARFVIGLSAYSRGAYGRALIRFEEAVNIVAWSEDDGKEVVWLFLGNTNGRIEEFPAAAAAFDEALRINEGYARALIGRADIIFQQSRGGCFPPANPEGLALAGEQFRTALAVPDPPPLADIRVKGTFGLGRVVLCQQIAGIAAESAEPLFEQVIGAYENGDDAMQRRLRELAAKSHANLGLLFASVQPVDVTRAIAEYQVGIDLTEDDASKAVFCSIATSVLDDALGLADGDQVTQAPTDQRAALSQACSISS